MAQLIIRQEDGLLEFGGFLLRIGDEVEILHLDCWTSGLIALDERGWHIKTSENKEIYLQTGLVARLSVLAP